MALSDSTILARLVALDDAVNDLQTASGIVYKVTSPSGKIYIGKTAYSLPKRKREHKCFATKYHSEFPFHRAIRKYGDELKWEILYKDIPENMLAIAEMCAIYTYDSIDNGYNCTGGGEGAIGNRGRIPWNKGLKTGPLSDEHKKKLSESHKGQITWNTGLKTGPISEETKYKISEKHRGKTISEESKRKMSEAKKGKYGGINHPNHKFGIDIANEIKEKYSSGRYSPKDLAKEYSLHDTTINRILNGKHWSNSIPCERFKRNSYSKLIGKN